MHSKHQSLCCDKEVEVEVVDIALLFFASDLTCVPEIVAFIVKNTEAQNFCCFSGFATMVKNLIIQKI
jgi:hypothetical protein